MDNGCYSYFKEWDDGFVREFTFAKRLHKHFLWDKFGRHFAFPGDWGRCLTCWKGRLRLERMETEARKDAICKDVEVSRPSLVRDVDTRRMEFRTPRDHTSPATTTCRRKQIIKVVLVPLEWPSCFFFRISLESGS